MLILSLETSCDETSVALVENGTKILSNVVASSVALHQKTGGIIPETAARQQLAYLLPVLEEALRQYQPQKELQKTLSEAVDALAVTIGPGLIGSLVVGVEAAKTLSFLTGKPLLPVNHLLGHLFANWLEKKEKDFPPLPAVALIASGGHTDLVRAEKKKKFAFSYLGGTRDDAAGECFDKCARVLGLGYPGGPAIAQAAANFSPKEGPKISLPRPMIGARNFDFSFSGLKTAVINKVRELEKKNQLFPAAINALAWEIQEAIADCLVKKTLRAAEERQAQAILLGGGVCANQRLREKLLEENQNRFPIFIPKPSFCTDNAAPIAAAAYFLKPTPALLQNLKAQPSLRIT
ncbi:tRNA (adenosine(37)-N6)-threonylcarbamoyltransferase complex transferase subunit TsaD [Candidatus Shapirobacteria bacterium]|nr:tRNA (adenosine(37)-N6)-threonylcarbamoyltransferase complex transferase subunit TsaD [Candidatus Shapirobacteria bacterium]